MVKLVKTVEEVPQGWWFFRGDRDKEVLEQRPLADEAFIWLVPMNTPVKHGLCASNRDNIKYLFRKNGM